MATITGRSDSLKQGEPVPSLRAIRVQLGTRTEAVSAANFGLKTLYSVFSTGVPMGGSTGTLVTAVVRNPGSSGARASVTAARLREDAGTLSYTRLLVGTVTVELLALGG